MKEEALKLADYLDNNVEAMLYTEQPYLDKASAMIRRLVEELDKQGEPVAWMYVNNDGECEEISFGMPYIKDPSIQLLYTSPQTKPLSAEDIGLLSTDKKFDYIHPQTLLMIVRLIEERHGIK